METEPQSEFAPLIRYFNPYLSDDACVERLYKEYQKHPKLIVAVDFDDTIFDFHKNGTDYTPIIDLVKTCQELGFYIVIFTASMKSRHEAILEYCKSIGIEVASINKNPIELPFGNEGKIYYNVFLDDRAGLSSSFYILSQLVERILEEKA